jgi:hypothetical protein
MNASPERRKHQRVKGPFEGLWDGTSGRVPARIVDMSVSGCFIESINMPLVGEVLFVHASVGEQRIQVKGEVVYSVANEGFAVRFVDVPAETAAALAELIAQRLAAE